MTLDSEVAFYSFIGSLHYSNPWKKELAALSFKTIQLDKSTNTDKSTPISVKTVRKIARPKNHVVSEAGDTQPIQMEVSIKHSKATVLKKISSKIMKIRGKFQRRYHRL